MRDVYMERLSPKERARIRKERLKWRRREVRHGLKPVRENVRGREKEWWGIEYKEPKVEAEGEKEPGLEVAEGE